MTNVQKVFLFATISFFISVIGSITRLPGGWRMFSKIEKVDLQMKSNSGDLIPLRKYVPGDFYVISEQQFIVMSQKICRIHFSKNGLNIFQGDKKVYSLVGANCELSKE